MRLLLAFLVLLFLTPVAFAVWVFFETEPVPRLTLPMSTEQGGILRPSNVGVESTGPRPVRFPTCTRILAIDGGGMRGMAPALILARLEQLTGKAIAKQFDLIAGTSTGAILALGLARPSESDANEPAFSAAELAALYEKHGTDFFPRSGSWLASLKRLVRPKYTSRGSAAVLSAYFGDVRMVEALTTVLIPVYDLQAGSRLWFDSFTKSSRDLLMSDLVRGATSAPTYLPPARFVVPDFDPSKHYVVAAVDGALFANNPAVEALAFADSLTRWDQQYDDKSVLMVSIGTGGLGRRYTFEEAWLWGLLGWANPLLEIAFNDPGIEKVASRLVTTRGIYHRLQVASDVALDDSSDAAVQRLKDTTAKLLREEDARLNEIAVQLSLARPDRCGAILGADYVRPEGPRQQPMKN